jgi:hypothetical protein
VIGSTDLISDVIAVVGYVFGIVLLPTLFNPKAYVPRYSSALTAAGLAVIGLCFADLSLWTAAGSEVFGTLVWVALFIWRGTPQVTVAGVEVK